MAQRFIGLLGAAVDDHSGAPLRTGGSDIEQDLNELFARPYGIGATGPQGPQGVPGPQGIQGPPGSGGTSDVVDPRDWIGFDPTGTNDVSSIMQSAIAQSLTAHTCVVVPAGLYVVSQVDLGVNNADGPQIIGKGSNYFGGNVFGLYNHGSDVVFQSAEVDKPCFYNSKRMLGLYMANIQILGPNIFTQYQPPNDFKQNYNLGQGMRDSPFSPLCGIAIDAFNCAVPPDGGYPGMTAKYAGSVQGASTGLFFENVSVTGFIVGIGNNFSGTSNQGDSWWMRNCNITMCDSAIATCSGQAKAANMLLGQIVNCRQAADGANYGVTAPGQANGFPVVMRGVNFGYLHRILNYRHLAGPLIVEANYVESVRSLGNFGTGSAPAKGNAVISGQQFTFDNTSSLPPPIFFETYAPAAIRDMNIYSASATSLAHNFGNDLPVPIKLDSVIFSGTGVAGMPPAIGIQGTSSNGSVVEFGNCAAQGSPIIPLSDNSSADVSAFTVANRFIGTVRSGRYSNGTGVCEYISPNATGVVSFAATAPTLVARAITFASIAANSTAKLTLSSGNWTDKTGWYMTTFPNADVRPVLYTYGSPTASLAEWGCSSAMTGPVACSAATVGFTFNATDPTIPQVGDLLMWYMIKQYTTSTHRAFPAWIITGIVGANVTAQPIFDATFYDTVANNFNGTNLSIVQRNWAPSGAALTCNTDGTAVLNTVAPATILKNGDWVNGPGIPANARVVLGGGTTSVTLNKNTTATASGVVLNLGTLKQPTLLTLW